MGFNFNSFSLTLKIFNDGWRPFLRDWLKNLGNDLLTKSFGNWASIGDLPPSTLACVHANLNCTYLVPRRHCVSKRCIKTKDLPSS